MDPSTVHWGDPYKLQGHRVVFTNWFYVNTGSFQWYDDQVKPVAVIGRQGPTEATYKQIEIPHGVRLKARPAERRGPLLQYQHPWEETGALGTIIHEDGIYRAWMNVGWGDLALFDVNARDTPYICYMESEDGYNWKRPFQRVIDYQGSKENNIVFKTLGFMGGGLAIFRDPSAPAAERYKMTAEWVYKEPEEREVFEQAMKKRPQDYNELAARRDINAYIGSKGAVSPDGIHWTELPDPILMTHTDTQQIGYWDSIIKKYVCYMRYYAVHPQAEGHYDGIGSSWFATGRRSIGRSESEDFRHFPLPQLVLEPAPDMKPTDLLYTHCYTTIPGAPDHHVMFPTIWDVSNDETSFRLATSHDGKMWNWIQGGPLLDTAPFGQWDGGSIFSHPNLIELPNGDWALPYTGFNVPHKYPRVKAERNSGYAMWPKGRLMAIEAAEEGFFSTVKLVASSERMSINAVTERAGWIQVEAVGADRQPLPGRSFDDCVPMFGDLHWAPIKWKEHDTLGVKPGEAVALRFRMRQASIYGVEFK